MVLQKKNKIAILIFLFLAAFIIWAEIFAQTKQGQILKLEFFDVGQGDAIFIETGSKKQMLIDGGPDAGILEKIGRVIPFYDRYIDIVMLTHPEQDHFNGLIEIIKRYDVGAVITNGIIRNTNQYKEWIKIIKEKNIPLFVAQKDGIIDFGKGIHLDVIYPFEKIDNKEISNSNNYSIVSKLVYGSFEALFTGDIEKSIEKKLIASGANLKSDVLKVAHHGSKTSTSQEFLDAVGAILAVIQMGKDNQYGHPHEEVLQRLKKIRALLTGERGDVSVFSDSQWLSTSLRASIIP